MSACPMCFFRVPNNTSSETKTTPDCVTEIRMGNTVLAVSDYFERDTTGTAADKMAKVLEATGQPGQIA